MELQGRQLGAGDAAQRGGPVGPPPPERREERFCSLLGLVGGPSRRLHRAGGLLSVRETQIRLGSWLEGVRCWAQAWVGRGQKAVTHRALETEQAAGGSQRGKQVCEVSHCRALRP